MEQSEFIIKLAANCTFDQVAWCHVCDVVAMHDDHPVSALKNLLRRDVVSNSGVRMLMDRAKSVAWFYE